MNRVLMMVGVPCCGKDTFLKNRHDYLDAYIASTDNIIEEWCKIDGISYHDGFSKFIKYAEIAMKAQIESAINKGQDIIWNQTNLTPKSRAKKLAMFDGKGYDKYALVFRIPDIHEILFRNLERKVNTGKFVPEDIIDSMSKQFTIPTLEEGFKGVWIMESVPENTLDATCIIEGKYWYRVEIIGE